MKDLSFENPSGQVIDYLVYSDSWYQDAIKDDGGWSLERKNPFNPCSSDKNWIASIDPSGGTPGRKNSTALSVEPASELITLFPLVFDPGGSTGPSQVSIRYSLEQNGWVGSFTIYSAAGREVKVLGQNQILGTSGIFSWTGTDDAGTRAPPGYYILVAQLFDLTGRIRVVKKTLVVGIPL